ncbi:GNAT family N-acetyltransferase [Comamonas aquatica]|uniref:GNAT family N-acetyltransferase n=1 Tax=Comamonas aquatica TaxID=225991 RepID=UPI00244AA4CF|nr:GNAT family N-acetyltransferase [Comamonas aquatica]MDH0370501.1 GNAT family N-acetyltransferase [Comamonas aquatica]
MSATCTLRAVQPDDAPALAALLQGIGWFDRFATGHPEAHADQLAPLLAPSPHQLQLVACDAQGQLIGYCAMHWLPIAILQGWEGYVSELFIADSARGLGVGSQLLDQVTAAARSRGCRRLWLVNNRQRDSYHRGFYARQGWQEQAQAARFVLDL